MPITIHCSHCNAELQLKKENKGPEGLLECPKCGCTFRVCLATFNRECFAKIHPKTEWKKTEKKEEMDIQMDFPSIPESIKGDAGFTAEDVKKAFKRKRGRPKKNEKIIEEEIDKEQRIRQDEKKVEWQGGPMQEVPEEKDKKNAA